MQLKLDATSNVNNYLAVGRARQLHRYSLSGTVRIGVACHLLGTIMDQYLQLQHLLRLQAGPWRQREEEPSDSEISESDIEEELDDVADSRNHNDAIMASSHLPTARGVVLASQTQQKCKEEASKRWRR